MRRGKITHDHYGHLDSARRSSWPARHAASSCRGQAPAPAAARRAGEALQARRREAGRMQHQAGVDLAAREGLELHVAGGLDQLQRAPRGQRRRRNSRTQAGRRSKPMVGDEGEAHAPQPRPARRARAPPRRAPAAPGAPGQQLRGRAGAAALRPAAAAQLHAALGDGRTATARPAGKRRCSSCAMACVSRRLRHVQAQRGAAEVQLLGDRQELAPGAQVDQGFFHIAEHINRRSKIGLEAISRIVRYLAPRDPAHKRQTMDTKTIQINRRSANITEGVARAPNRSMYYAHGLPGGRLQQADDRRRQRPLDDHAVQLGPAEAGRRRGRRHRGSRRQRRRSSARRPSPTAWRWAPRA